MLPSWLGVGHGLTDGIEEHEVTELQKMYKQWPFFRSTLDLIEMVLAKADPVISRYYDRLLAQKKYNSLSSELHERFEQTVRSILKFTGRSQLLENNITLQQSIQQRNPYVDPLNLIQAYLLKCSQKKTLSPTQRDALLIAINGIAAGMRNTG